MLCGDFIEFFAIEVWVMGSHAPDGMQQLAHDGDEGVELDALRKGKTPHSKIQDASTTLCSAQHDTGKRSASACHAERSEASHTLYCNAVHAAR